MKSKDIRTFYQLMNSELLFSYQKVISSLSFLLAVREEMAYKDQLTPEEKITEEASERVSESAAILLPLLCENIAVDTLENSLANAGIFTPEMIDDIVTVYLYRRESKDDSSPLFDLHDTEMDDFKDYTLLFYQRLITSYRVMALLNDITLGIEEYGVEPYMVPEDHIELDVLDNFAQYKKVSKLTPQECIQELLIYLSPKEDDSDEALDDKSALLSLIKELGESIKGE